MRQKIPNIPLGDYERTSFTGVSYQKGLSFLKDIYLTRGRHNGFPDIPIVRNATIQLDPGELYLLPTFETGISQMVANRLSFPNRLSDVVTVRFVSGSVASGDFDQPLPPDHPIGDLEDADVNFSSIDDLSINAFSVPDDWDIIGPLPSIYPFIANADSLENVGLNPAPNWEYVL